MKVSELFENPGRPIAYYPKLRKVAGSTNAALLLCQLIYWTGKEASRDGWIYKTAEDLERETSLSRREQERARRMLLERGLTEERYARREHRMYFRVEKEGLRSAWTARYPGEARLDAVSDDQADCEVTEEHFARFPKGISPSDDRAVREVADGHFPNIPTGNSLNSNTEITTENTTESTQREAAGALAAGMERELDKALAAAPPPPPSPPGGEEPSSAAPELALFREVTDFLPRKASWESVIAAIRQVRQRRAREPSAADLKPYYVAWCNRGHNPRNLAWLTEWAASGVIPGREAHGYRSKQAERDEFERRLDTWVASKEAPATPADGSEPDPPPGFVDAEVLP
jgi:hypothetical protein